MRFALMLVAVASLTTAPLAPAQADPPAVGPAGDPQADPPPPTPGKIDAVTVYRDQALVTRAIQLNGDPGVREVVVGPLPAEVQPGSLYAEGGPGVEIRSVRYRNRPVEQDVRQEVRDLDAQIQDTRDQLHALQQRLQLTQQAVNYLNRLEQFTANTAMQEMKHGVLNAETIEGLSDYLFTTRSDVIDAQLQAEIDRRDAQEQLNLLQRQRAELTRGSARTAREAVVLVETTGAPAPARGGGGAAAGRPGSFTLSYLVNQASWTPSYIARAQTPSADAQPTVTLEYYASIQQASGESWDDVAMTLSTASPSLVASAPVLEPLRIDLQVRAPASAGELMDNLNEMRQRLAMLQAAQSDYNRQRELGKSIAGPPSSPAPQARPQGAAAGLSRDAAAVSTFADGLVASSLRSQSENGQAFAMGQDGWRGAFTQNDVALNLIANERQRLELANTLASDRRANGGGGGGGETLPGQPGEPITVTYQLAQRTSLPSRRDQQMIRIAQADMPADIYRLAVPVLTPRVYREAQVTNTSGRVLLAGPIASYLDGQFVGRGALATVAAGEEMTVGLGIDASLRTARELVTTQEQVQGGNKLVTLTYDLSIDNFGSKPADIRLTDRVPVAADDDAVRVILGQGADAASEDPKTGILTWNVTAPPQTYADTATQTRYTYTIEHDRQMTVAGLAAR